MGTREATAQEFFLLSLPDGSVKKFAHNVYDRGDENQRESFGT